MRSFRVTLLLLVLSPVISWAQQKQQPPRLRSMPNILLVVVDDLGYSDIAAYGGSFIETPNLDKLARQGTMLTQAYAASGVCSPSRVALLTGRHPARVGITNYLYGMKTVDESPVTPPDYKNRLPTTEKTIGSYFTEAGYRTAFFGKWHLGLKDEDSESEPRNMGFEKQFPTYKPAGNGFKEQPCNLVCKDSAVTFEALSWLRNIGNQRFMAVVSFYSPHIPIASPFLLTEKYNQKLVTMNDGRHHESEYAGMVENLDKNIGMLLYYMQQNGLDKNTIVVVVSDNGGLDIKENDVIQPTDNKPFRAGKGSLYEGGIRVPMIVRYPGIVPMGKTYDQPFSLLDVMPTLMSWSALKPDPYLMPDGAVLTAELVGRKRADDRALYWHYPHFSNQHGMPAGAVLFENYKLIQRYDDGSLELYNLATDKEETTNLIKKEKAKTKQLLAMLSDWRNQVNAQMMLPNPKYKGNIAKSGAVLER